MGARASVFTSELDNIIIIIVNHSADGQIERTK